MFTRPIRRSRRRIDSRGLRLGVREHNRNCVGRRWCSLLEAARYRALSGHKFTEAKSRLRWMRDSPPQNSRAESVDRLLSAAHGEAQTTCHARRRETSTRSFVRGRTANWPALIQIPAVRNQASEYDAHRRVSFFAVDRHSLVALNLKSAQSLR